MLKGELGKHALCEGDKAVAKYNACGAPGLSFPVDACALLLTGEREKNVRVHCYFTALLEYLSAEVLELGGNVARANGTETLACPFLREAINDDDELRESFMIRAGVTMDLQDAE